MHSEAVGPLRVPWTEVGMCVDGFHARVSFIGAQPRQVKDRGIYAPLTFSGRLAVNGVVVSSYAASSSTMAKAWQLH